MSTSIGERLHRNHREESPTLEGPLKDVNVLFIPADDGQELVATLRKQGATVTIVQESDQAEAVCGFIRSLVSPN